MCECAGRVSACALCEYYNISRRKLLDEQKIKK